MSRWLVLLLLSACGGDTVSSLCSAEAVCEGLDATGEAACVDKFGADLTLSQERGCVSEHDARLICFDEASTCASGVFTAGAECLDQMSAWNDCLVGA